MLRIEDLLNVISPGITVDMYNADNGDYLFECTDIEEILDNMSFIKENGFTRVDDVGIDEYSNADLSIGIS